MSKTSEAPLSRKNMVDEEGYPRVTRRLVVETPHDRNVNVDQVFKAEHTRLLDKFAKLIETEWMSKAALVIHTTLKEYKEGASVKPVSDGVELTLEGWLPVALETGGEPYDMKPGLLGNRESRVIPIAKDPGQFRTVSKHSPPDSWWHPGFEGLEIHKELEADADKLLQEAFGNYDRVKV